ncbi:hypothetical protein C7M84_020948 [Penaeus vannamei]|uniref:RNA-directed DNA polymerase n=1 Tax=Penaeus vannamei TaxID=6689 RepID=A0A3R7P4V1_PENVA|nr:hypothetical protein C7M84_020948 [Penaeus vannamei]
MSLPLATQVSRHCGGQASQPWPHLPRLLPLPTHLLHVPYLLKVFLVSIFIQTTLFLFRLLRQLRQVPQAIPTTLTMRGVSRVLLGNDNFRQCALRSGAPIIGPRHHFLPAEETFHVSPQVVSPKGRPTIQVRVNSKVLTAFVDTAPVHVVQTEFIEPKSGQFVSAAVARGLPESRAILVEGTNPKFIVPRSISAVQGRRTSVWVDEISAQRLPSFQPKFTDATTQVHSLAEIDADELAPRSCKVWPADEQVAECPSDTSDDDIELYTPALSGSDACSDDSVLSPNKSGINVVESSDSPSKQVDLGHLDSVQQEELDEALAVNENHSVNSDTPVNLATLASAVLREYQLKEDLWKEIIEFLEGKKLPRRALPASLHEFELDDGVLYHLKSLPDRIIRQVCVPHSLQSQALHLAHDHPTAAHPGALRTYHNLQNSYFFPNMFRLCKWYVQHCTACQHRKGSRERAEMQCRPPPSGPLELVSADLMDLRASVGGYRYVLSIVDHHSRYLQLVPLRNKTAETVLRGFYDHFITLFGPPRQIMTDNGGEFANEQWQEVSHKFSHTSLGGGPASLPPYWEDGLVSQGTHQPKANAQAHNRKVRSTWQPEEGALVLRRDFTGGALQDRWQGPCRVIKQIGPVVFEVKDLQPPYRIVKQHRDQLKMYLPPAELDYVEVGDRLPSDPPGVDGPLPGRPQT